MSFLSFLGLVAFSSAVRAQGITVEQTGGQKSAGGEKTTLEFSTTTNESVRVDRILEQITSSTGHSATDFTTLCTTPCTLSVDPGYYKMRFGQGGAFDPNVDISVRGGKRSFAVKPSRLGYIAGGAGLIVGGVLVGALGFAVQEGSYSDDTRHVSMTGRIMNISGLVAIVAGGFMSFGLGLGSVHEHN